MTTRPHEQPLDLSNADVQDVVRVSHRDQLDDIV